MTRLLDGEVLDPKDARIIDLENELRQAKRERSDAEQSARDADRVVAEGLSALRRQLTPLYRALQAVFGELDSISVGVDETPAPSARVSAVWESWKAKLPGLPAKAIEALLLHGEMTTQQVAIAIGTSRQHAGNIISKLNMTGLINKNGGRFSLKQL